jgi:hypothetical protein
LARAVTAKCGWREVFWASSAPSGRLPANFRHERPYEREFEASESSADFAVHESQVDILHAGRNDEAGYFYYVMELAIHPKKKDECRCRIKIARSVGSVSAFFIHLLP